jgi:hypothetical protein
LRHTEIGSKIPDRRMVHGVLADLQQSAGRRDQMSSPPKTRPDLGHHVLEGVWVRFAAEDENLVTMLVGPLVLIELVAVYARRESDVAGVRMKGR